MANLSNINNKFLVTTTGEVLIGGTAAIGAAKLQVTGEARVYTGSNLGYWGVDAGNSYVYLGTNSSGYGLSFQTAGTERMRIDSSGNMQFNGNATISSNTADGSDNAQIIIAGGGTDGDTRGASVHISGNESGNGGLLQLRAGDGSVGGIRFYTGGSERMRLAGRLITFNSTTGVQEIRADIASAKFAIGNMGDASSQMMVSSRGFLTFNVSNTGSAFDATERMRITSGGDITVSGGDIFLNSGTNYNDKGVVYLSNERTAIISDIVNATANGDTSLDFQTRKSGTRASALFIDEFRNATFAGNVTVNGGQILSPGGVNIALNPNTGIVTVGGSIQCTGAGASTFNGALLLNKSDGTYISLNHNNSLKGYLGIANQVITGGSASDIGLTANNDLVFGSGGTAARMYIKSDGKIGLGKSSPYYPIDATEIGANSHAWGSSGATFGQDHYQIRELNNLLWNAYDRFKDYGSSSNLTYAMFDGNFDSGTALPTNSTHVIEIDFGAQGAMTYPYGFTVISFYYVYNNFTSLSGEQYHAAGTYGGQWRAMGTPVDIRGSAGSGVRVVKIPGGNNNYVTKFRYTFVTGSSSVNVSDICYMTSRPAGYPISAYMRGDRNNNWFKNIYFLNSSFTTIGSIIPGGSSTAYNTSSDYRLKENIVEMTGALDRVSQLKPSRFNFISDADKTVDGFLAHEVQEIIPEAITGEKDAVDEQGNPKLQAIDQSKLVPLLVGAIKELKAEIELLKSK